MKVLRHLGWMLSIAVIALAGCPGDDDDTGSAGEDDDSTPGDDDTTAGDDDDSSPEPPMEFLFTFAILADPHVFSSGQNLDRLDAAIAWINSVAEDRQVELTLLLGDVAWNSGLDVIVASLDALEMPCVPLIGDNEIQSGDEEAFDVTFEPSYESLSTQLDHWSRSATPVYNPLAEQDSWFSNISFDHRGVHFVAADWCVRGGNDLMGQLGELHDFAGGTFPWFAADIAATEVTTIDSIVMASHIPMHVGLFDLDELAQFDELLRQYEAQVYAQFAGHAHADAEWDVGEGLYTVYVTDDTFEDDLRVRLVEVSGNGQRFAYEHELVDVPY